MDLIKTKNVNYQNKLSKAAELTKVLKEEVDKNPMLKFIVGSHQISGNLRDLVPSKNPIAQLDSRNSYYNNGGKDWSVQMAQDSVDLFKVQLSSLIK